MNEFNLLDESRNNIELNNENENSKNDLVDKDISKENEKLKNELKEKDKIISKMEKQNILLDKLLLLRDKKIQELKKELNETTIKLNETKIKLEQYTNQNQNNLNELFHNFILHNNLVNLNNNNIQQIRNNFINNNQGIRNNNNINNNNQNSSQSERQSNQRNNRIENQNRRLNLNRIIRNGLTQIEINRIPNETFNDKFNYINTSCIICMNEFKNGDLLKRLGCLHIFHVDCITSWLKRKRICPIDNHRVNVNLNG